MPDRLTDVRIPDFRDIERRIAELGGTRGLRILINGVAAAARVARNATRASRAFTDRSGGLRAGIVVRRRRGRVVLRGAAPHTHLVELGHGGPHPAAPHPFLVPSVEGTRDAQVQAAAKTVERLLRREFAKRR